jgi:hypothetical protein
MTLHHGFICLALLLCAGCAKTANIPPADLTLSSFEMGPNNLFTVKFKSTVNLTRAFNDYENANQLTPTLTCSLNHDLDFSSEHSINVRAEGLVTAAEKPPQDFAYISELVFYNTKSDGTQHDLNDYEAIKPLLLTQPSVPCKVRITAYGYNAYYSNTLLIPTTAIINTVLR